jgi:ubiquinone biosynthesis protein COQ9
MPKQQRTLKNRILDQALELAERSSWEQLHLRTVADELKISLDEIRRCYAQKDDLVEAWFDRADASLLSAPRSDEFLAMPLNERLHQVIMTWLEALAPHRRLTREMLAYKLEPGHVHLQALGIMRISRTVQWFCEASGQDSTGLRRIVDECALTTIYLTAFARWLFDDSANSIKTRDLLDTALRQWPGLSHNDIRSSAKAAAVEEARQPGQ